MGKSTTTTNEAAKTEIDPALKQMYMDNYGQAQAIGGQMTATGPYTGQRVAGPTEAFDRASNMIAGSAAGLAGDIPPWAAGQSIGRAEGWLNDAVTTPYQEVGAYGYDPSKFNMKGATVDPAQQNIYTMARNAVRDQTSSAVPRNLVRDVNPGGVDRSLVRDVNTGEVDRSLVRDVSYANATPRDLVRDVSYNGVPRGSVRDIKAGTLFSGMPQYETAYTDQVINRGLLDLDRGRQMTMQGVGADAVRAGAFGGSRHGIVESETNRGFADAAARLTADERAKAFAQAGEFAGRDVANTLASDKSNQDADWNMAGLNQTGSLAAAKGNQDTDLAMAGLRQQGAIAEGNANQGADLTMAGLRQAGSLTSGQANQAADINMAGLRQAGLLTSGQANQGADVAMAAQNLQAGAGAQAGNQAMDFQTAMANLNAMNTGAGANTDRRGQAAMASAGYGQQAAGANQQAATEALRFNAGQSQQADQVNQAGGFQNISQLLQAAQQLQGLAGTQYSMPMDAAGKMMGLDQYARGMTNEQLQALMQEYDDKRYAALPGMQLQAGALGMQLPNLGMSSTGKSTSTYAPSGMQTLSQIVGMGAGLGSMFVGGGGK